MTVHLPVRVRGAHHVAAAMEADDDAVPNGTLWHCPESRDPSDNGMHIVDVCGLAGERGPIVVVAPHLFNRRLALRARLAVPVLAHLANFGAWHEHSPVGLRTKNTDDPVAEIRGIATKSGNSPDEPIGATGRVSRGRREPY